MIALLTDEVIKSKLTKDKDMAAALYLLRGNARYENNDYEEAIGDYSKAIDINPDYYLAYYNRASTRGAKQEKYSEAIVDYNKVIEICQDKDIGVCPDKAYYYASRGTAFKSEKKYTEALYDYNKAIEIDPNYALPYYNIGLVKKETNELKEAKKYFTDYLNIITIANDTSSKYARYYINVVRLSSHS